MCRAFTGRAFAFKVVNLGILIAAPGHSQGLNKK